MLRIDQKRLRQAFSKPDHDLKARPCGSGRPGRLIYADKV
jgi:hypothetical protein